jgi:hypothetical protein
MSEINARMTMADLARTLKEKTGARYASIRMIQRTALPPITGSEAFAVLPGCAFSRAEKCGVICATPLEYTAANGEVRSSQRLLLFFAAASLKALHQAERAVDRLHWHRSGAENNG